MKKQSGFSALEIVMAIVIVGLLAAVSWMFIANANKKAEQSATATTSTKTESKPVEETSTKTYTSSQLKLAFDYPAEWTVKKNDNSGNKGVEGYNHNGDKLLVISPTGYTLFFDEMKPDGLGGICMPIEVSDFKLFGKTKLDIASYVVGYEYEGRYSLYISMKSTKDDADNDSCTYNSLIQIAERSEEDKPNILLFGNRAIGEEQVSTTKPNSTELQQAADILLSVRQS